MIRDRNAPLCFLLALAALSGAAPARGGFEVAEPRTVIQFLTTYNVANETSNYFRMSIQGLTNEELDREHTGGLRRTPIGGGFYAFPEAIYASNVQPFQPNNLNRRYGFIDFRVRNPRDPREQLFRPGDEVTFTVTVKGQLDLTGLRSGPNIPAKFRVATGLWRTGDGGVGANSTQGQVKLTGAGARFNPHFFLYNDLDLNEYGGFDAPFGIRNLRFIDNMTPEDFDALALRPIYDEGLQSSLPRVDLSSSGAISPRFSQSEQTYVSPFASPMGGRFAGAYGQIVDPFTGEVIAAFKYGSLAAVPGPANLLLAGVGSALLSGYGWWRRKRRAAGGASLQIGGP